MAEGVRFICGNCRKAIEAWSDGNPYYLDSDGAKQCAYHPDHERLALCIGNDSPHICLACGGEFMVDSLAPVAACPDCGATEIAHTFGLDGVRCPYCKVGEFDADPGFHCVS
jgi:DNA-directed RNA polymerase subunit RPC12/RpoP